MVGGGAWGTALACVLSEKSARGEEVHLWSRNPEVVEAIKTSRCNKLYLPNITIPDTVVATGEWKGLKEASAVLLVVPAQFQRSVLRDLRPHVTPQTPLVLCSKGIEVGSLNLMSEIANQELPQNPCAVLSGPSFATEVASGLPTALTLACTDESHGRRLVALLNRQNMRLYFTNDVIGAQLGGAVKNVLAIACGIVAGKGLGENARAALIARGHAELVRFAVALGARPETIAGLSGLGDLVLTCSSRQSRNMSLGARLGAGESLKEILDHRRSVTEGVKSAEAIISLAVRHQVDMPICAAVAAILSGAGTVDQAIEALLSRPLPDEM